MVGPSHHPGQEFDERIAEETDKASAVITVGNIWFPVQQQTRRLPGFKALVRNLELANYWRKSGKWGDFAAAKHSSVGRAEPTSVLQCD